MISFKISKLIHLVEYPYKRAARHSATHCVGKYFTVAFIQSVPNLYFHNKIDYITHQEEEFSCKKSMLQTLILSKFQTHSHQFEPGISFIILTFLSIS